jgi:chromate transporter
VGVILNLALWFALHSIFRSVRPFAAGPLRFDLPVPASVDPWALLLALGAIVAVLRFKAGTLPTLAVTAAIGVALYLAGLAG